MKKTILITGANGMLGQEAMQLFAKYGYEVIKAGRKELDITDFSKVKNFFQDVDFDFVLHTASYTKVDDSETNQELAFSVNCEGAKNIAIAAKIKAVPIIYISTDYVFDGEKGSPYFVNDKTNPLNVYGSSKLAGEDAVKKENPMHYIVRTSWLYGQYGKNFVDTMINLSQTHKSIKVVNDQIGCPTWTVDLIGEIKNLIEKPMPFGTYQLSNSGFVSWFDFAKKIFEILKIEIEIIPVGSNEFVRPAKRPKFSAMENNGMLRKWDEALRDYLSGRKPV
jgi:dTDP-4-dehydrorhamnose reductase